MAVRGGGESRRAILQESPAGKFGSKRWQNYGSVEACFAFASLQQRTATTSPFHNRRNFVPGMFYTGDGSSSEYVLKVNQVVFTLELTLLAFNKSVSRTCTSEEYLYEFVMKKNWGELTAH